VFGAADGLPAGYPAHHRVHVGGDGALKLFIRGILPLLRPPAQNCPVRARQQPTTGGAVRAVEVDHDGVAVGAAPGPDGLSVGDVGPMTWRSEGTGGDDRRRGIGPMITHRRAERHGERQLRAAEIPGGSTKIEEGWKKKGQRGGRGSLAVARGLAALGRGRWCRGFRGGGAGDLIRG